jgi:thioredoxin reductase (NADPH)
MVRKLIIIGSGPAGYTAAVYAARAELKPLVLAGEKSGGQLMDTQMVENWPGTEKGVMGPELMMEMRKQAQRFGAEILDKNATKVDFSQRPFKVWVKEEEYTAEAVIIATGAERVMLGVPGEKELMGKGVATCAVCDAAFYKDKVTYVIGGGDTAVDDALVLTKYAKEVYLIHRRDELRASKIMVKRVKENPKIKILWNTELKEVIGEKKVERVRLIDKKTNKEQVMAADGVFLAIGHKPATEMFKGQLELDEKGYVKVKWGWENEFLTMTSVEGVLAAGDVVDFKYKQAVTAAGMGCMAALDAERWLEKRDE